MLDYITIFLLFSYKPFLMIIISTTITFKNVWMFWQNYITGKGTEKHKNAPESKTLWQRKWMLEMMTSKKDLGVFIDEELKFHQHVAKAVNNADQLTALSLPYFE